MIKEKRFNVEEHPTLDGRVIDVFPISHRYIHNLEQQVEKLQQENKQLKDDWNKLKEYIRKTKLKEFEKSYGRRYGKTFTQAEVILCNMITNYMQELEKENDSNE